MSADPIHSHLTPDVVSRASTPTVDPHGSAQAPTAYHHRLKRVFDVACASGLLLLLSPVLLAIVIAIKLDSRGPVFYRVRRVGRHGQPLMMLKFRKMTDHAVGAPLTAERDPRLTRVGSRLTRARLDELPQLWDVVCGRMSIVGPRPEDPAFVALHPHEYERILAVRPGITGMSQIAYKEEARIVDATSPIDDYIERIMPEKLTMDTLYARAASFTVDLTVLYWTFVTVVLRRPVSVNRLTGAMRIRRRRPLVALRLAEPVAELELPAPAPDEASSERVPVSATADG